MNRHKLGSLAAVVLTSALVLGAAATPATAAKPAGKGHAKTAATKGKPAKVRTGKPAKAAQPFTAHKRVVLKRIAATDAALVRQEGRVESSGIAEAPLVLANITADRVALDALETDLSTAATLVEVRAVSALVAAVRPEVYSLVVNALARAARVDAVVAATDTEVLELAALADAKELEGHDVTAVRALLDGVAAATVRLPAAATAVVDAGVLLTAQSTAADRAAFAALVEALDVLLEEVEAGLVEAEALLAALVTEPVEEPTTVPVADPVDNPVADPVV